MQSISTKVRMASAMFALIASTAVLGGTVAAMTASAQPQALAVVVMERTIVQGASAAN